MIQSASGIILRTRPLTETSLIVSWLTPEFGRISTAAKGARRPKSSFAGKLDLFYEADFNFTRSQRSDLHALREVQLRETHLALRHDVVRIQQAGYCAMLIEQTTEMDTPIPEVHTLFSEFLQWISMQPPKPRSVFAFELKLLRNLGLEPDIGETKLSPDTRKLVVALTELEWKGIVGLRATAAQALEIQQFLHGFLIFHLGKIPKGRVAALGH